jgi:hypothetical protein
MLGRSDIFGSMNSSQNAFSAFYML